MTYREICLRLESAGIENAEWDASLLLEHFCGVNLLALRSEQDRDYRSAALEDADSGFSSISALLVFPV